MSILTIVFAILLALKLSGLTAVSWLVVFSPLILVAGLILFSFIGLIIVAAIGGGK